MKIAFTIAIFIALLSPATAIEVQFDGTAAEITDSVHNFRVSHLLQDDAFYGVVHAIQKRGDFYYLVFSTSWPSRGASATGGMCGAGIESAIKWVQIKNKKIIKEQEGRYESCFKHRDGWTINWHDNELIWTSEAFEYKDDSRDSPIIKMNYTWTFDTQDPAAGIREKKQEAEQDAAANP